MKVLIFCASSYRVAYFAAAFHGSSHALAFVCCNPSPREGAVKFYLSQLYHLVRRRPRSLPRFLWQWMTGRVKVTHYAIDSPEVRSFIARSRPEIALHALGVIYRQPTIRACGRGILNAHIGRLPKYRGRSVMEWSLLCGDETGVTVFFIDEGIDTGRDMVLFEPVSVAGIRSLDAAKELLFSQDARLYRRAVDALAAGGSPTINDIAQGARFYEMSGLFRRALAEYRDRTTGDAQA